MLYRGYGNAIPAAVQHRNPQVRSPLLLAPVLLLLVLLPAGWASAQTGAPGHSTGHRLVGTIEGGRFSGAVLVDLAGEQRFYRLNETLPDGSRLFKLTSESILIRQTDGAVSEVFIFRELRSAVPVNPETSLGSKSNKQTDMPPRRQRPVRHKSSMYEAHEE